MTVGNYTEATVTIINEDSKFHLKLKIKLLHFTIPTIQYYGIIIHIRMYIIYIGFYMYMIKPIHNLFCLKIFVVKLFMVTRNVYVLTYIHRYYYM